MHDPRSARRCRRGAGAVRATVALTTACAAFGSAACAPAGPATPGFSPAAAVPRATVPSADAGAVNTAKSAALAAYNGYLSAYVTAARTANWHDAAIDRYTADPFRQQAKLTLYSYAQNHIVLTGRPRSHPVASSVNTTTSPHSVVLTDCVDASSWRPMVRSTGKPAADNAPTRYAASILVVQYASGQWLVQQVTKATVPSC